jgi:hypothetical protein
MMCEECSGQGYVEIGPDCDRPASMCCGGCYKKVKCETCKGKGYEENKYIPFSFPVRSKISWWKKQGSFNVELYLALCQAKKD